jgi:uncharacterized LabA/DUF88 family protein
MSKLWYTSDILNDFMESPQRRTALFIDAENLYYIQKTLGWEIDFERLYQFFAKKTLLYNAFYYTSVDPQSEKHAEKVHFLEGLPFVGYTVRSKEVKIIKAGDRLIKKGNLDIEIVIDMFNTMRLYDQVVLFSGDSDFARALELLRTHGKEIIVISTKGFVSKELINTADKYVDIQRMAQDIKKNPEAAAPSTVPSSPTVVATPRPKATPHHTRVKTTPAPVKKEVPVATPAQEGKKPLGHPRSSSYAP